MFFKKKKLPDYWLISFTRGKCPKQYQYMLYGFSVDDVIQKHKSNPNYENTKIVGIIQIIDEEDYN